MTSLEKRHESQSWRQSPLVDDEELKLHAFRDGAAQYTGSRLVQVKIEIQQPCEISFPSFRQRLVVQDAAGNTCGACIISFKHSTWFEQQSYKSIELDFTTILLPELQLYKSIMSANTSGMLINLVEEASGG